MKENEQYTSEGRHNDAEFKVLDGQKGLTDGQREIYKINRGRSQKKKEQIQRGWVWEQTIIFKRAFLTHKSKRII